MRRAFSSDLTHCFSAHSCRGRVARHAKALARVADVTALDFQDREILRQAVADVKIFAVWCEHGFRWPTELDILGLADFLVVDS
jgi:hypothetical protein